ncbi:hypothetical protein J5I95_10405 [Candidatus Poribacteria bacterium]|nr:hypothetical protein [Candidatus Poribacteria bacterium]
MQIKIVVLFAMTFATIIGLVGCGPKLIDPPDNSGRATTVKVGRTENGLLYEFGVVAVRYDEATQQETDLTDGIPSAAVNDFFIKRGYTPKVKGLIIDYEVISFSSDVDPYPMLEKIRNIPGVVEIDLHVFHKTSELLFAASLDYSEAEEHSDVPSVGRAIVEVGRMKDGALYELGVVLIQYDEMRATEATATKAVNNFLVRKGYAPKTINSFSDFVVIDVGKSVDTTPMLRDIEAIPGVISARLNLLHTTLEVLRGESDVPGMSLF